MMSVTLLKVKDESLLEEVATNSSRFSSRRARAIRVTAEKLLPSPTLVVVESCSTKNYSIVFSHPLNTLQMAKTFIWKSIKIMSESSPVVEGVFGKSHLTISFTTLH
jgi:hypothetical protein